MKNVVLANSLAIYRYFDTPLFKTDRIPCSSTRITRHRSEQTARRNCWCDNNDVGPTRKVVSLWRMVLTWTCTHRLRYCRPISRRGFTSTGPTITQFTLSMNQSAGRKQIFSPHKHGRLFSFIALHMAQLHSGTALSNTVRLTHLPAFYPRDAMLARVFAIATCCLSVRPSVCLSVTRRYCA